MKIRTFSSLTGIMISVASLTVSFNFSETAKKEIFKSMEGMVTNLIMIKPISEFSREISSPPLNENDVFALKRAFLGVGNICPIFKKILPSSSEQRVIIGCDTDFPFVIQAKMIGSFFNSFESEAKRRVCVLGMDLYNELIQKGESNGETVRVYNMDFHVTGVIEAADYIPIVDTSNAVFIPWQTLQSLVPSITLPDAVLFRVEENELPVSVIPDIENVLMANRIKKNYIIWDQNAIIEKKKKMVDTIEWLVQSVPMLFLIVACISAANILFVSVTERTKEIGLRMALGATRNQILCMILTEGLLLVLSGGILGILLGYFFTIQFLKPLTQLIAAYETWNFRFSYISVAKSILTLTGFAFFSSFIPAYRAAQLEPTIALRQE